MGRALVVLERTGGRAGGGARRVYFGDGHRSTNGGGGALILRDRDVAPGAERADAAASLQEGWHGRRKHEPRAVSSTECASGKQEYGLFIEKRLDELHVVRHASQRRDVQADLIVGVGGGGG